ncbi:MAG: alanine racemase [Trebonia sp.]|jgi:D-serine deaminase-like pyridoxal phosphate-dependent protein
MTTTQLPRNIAELQTPAPLVDGEILAANLARMAQAWPGDRLRPHVKAHKCTELARHQRAAGHPGFTCATIREVEGMVAAGLGQDLLLANEVLDAARLGTLVAAGARVTVAVDSAATTAAAARAGVREVLIDVNVGLPRCGCSPDDAGSLAELARGAGLEVRGVMGYEGHTMIVEDRADRARQVAESMALLERAHAAVGGPVRSAGGTGSWDLNSSATELQAGSYALMDTAYAALGLPFGQALSILATVISVNQGGWAVADCGLKALGMDHGNPSLADGSVVWFCSDEHVIFSPPAGGSLPQVGDQVRVLPAHVDPTMAYHERLYLVADDRVLEAWPVDLRGW